MGLKRNQFYGVKMIKGGKKCLNSDHHFQG